MIDIDKPPFPQVNVVRYGTNRLGKRIWELDCNFITNDFLKNLRSANEYKDIKMDYEISIGSEIGYLIYCEIQ